MPSPPDLSQAFSQPKRLFTYGPLPQRINYVNVTFITEVISNKKEMNDYYLPNFLFCQLFLFSAESREISHSQKQRENSQSLKREATFFPFLGNTVFLFFQSPHFSPHLYFLSAREAAGSLWYWEILPSSSRVCTAASKMMPETQQIEPQQQRLIVLFFFSHLPLPEITVQKDDRGESLMLNPRN